MNISTQIHTGAVAEESDTTSNPVALYRVMIAILFTAFLVWLVYMLLDPATLPVKQVKIEGEFRHLSEEKLHELVHDKARGNFFNLDVSAVRNALLADPWVRDVSVQRVWPDTIRVFVTEQFAVARWGDKGLLNDRGRFFAPAANTYPDNLPLLAGPDGTQILMLEKYIFLEKVLGPHDLHVGILRLNERRAWLFELDDGLKVELGRENFEERASRFVQLVINGLATRISEAEKIDMRYPNGYAVLWKAGGVETTSGNGAL